MIKWYKNLLTGTMTSDEIRKAVEAAQNGRIQKNLFFIVLPQNPLNLYDIIKHVYLEQDYYKEREVSVVGIAKSRGEAIELVSGLITKTYQESGRTRIMFEPGDFSEEPAEKTHC